MATLSEAWDCITSAIFGFIRRHPREDRVMVAVTLCHKQGVVYHADIAANVCALTAHQALMIALSSLAVRPSELTEMTNDELAPTLCTRDNMGVQLYLRAADDPDGPLREAF